MDFFKHAIAASCVAAALVLGVRTSAQAQSPGLQGIYVNEAQSRDPIEAAIQAGTAKMSFIIRPLARSRMRKTNPLLRRIEIARTELEISVVYDGGKPVRMPADGTITQWAREDGEVFDVAADWRGDQLVQRFKAKDGERINTFRLSPDGTQLTLQVELRSPQLPAPVSYVLSFAPQPAR
jgi:hypothetical protein